MKVGGKVRVLSKVKARIRAKDGVKGGLRLELGFGLGKD